MVFNGLEEVIRKILAYYNIKTPIIGTYNLASQNTPERAKDTILICTYNKNNILWKTAASEIYKLVEPIVALSYI